MRARTLLVASLVIAAVLTAGGVADLRRTLREGREALGERAGLLATIQAGALAVPLWDFDDAQVEAVLAALALDPDFRHAAVRDPRGKVLAERSNPAAPGSATLRSSSPILHEEHATTRTLGTLELELSTDRLTDAAGRRVRLQALTSLGLLGAVLAAVLAAFREVTRPLDLMARVTARLAAGDHAVEVPGRERADEIGAVARAVQVFKEKVIALALAEEKYRAIYENAALGIYRSTPDGALLSANPALVRIMGGASEAQLLALLGRPGAIATEWYVEPERRVALAELLRRTGAVAGVVSRVRRRDGRVAWVSETARAVRDAGGRLVCYEGTIEDITERKQLEDEERLRVRAAVESAGDAIAIADTDGAPVYLNPAFLALLGRERADLAPGGEGLAALFADAALARDLFAAVRDVGGRWSGETELAARDGALVPVAIRASAIGGGADGAVGSVLIITDVRERKAAEARIHHLAHHDALTGLPNRVLFRDRLEHALARGRRSGEAVAVLAVDLDGFKAVNDTLGHAAGDRLLEAVAERLRAATRGSETVARLGGDEFAVVLAARDHPAAADALARRLVAALGAPFDLDGREALIGASVGVAAFPADAGDADGLLRRADLALYRAKADGRGTHRFFEERMDAQLRARRALEHDLGRALASGQFELHYQPQVDLADGAVTGAEALLRWRRDGRGPVPPAEFVPLAEETGLIVPIGAWVLETACAAAAGWPGRPRVAVNLSPVQFRQPGLADAVARVLRRTGLDPDRLELEITEGVLLHYTEATVGTLAAFKALGVRVALDDFGTGYSSLSYLRRFPFDKIKIDRSFVAGLGREAAAGAIVRAIVGLGRGLGVATVAEGVETAEQVALLLAAGCGEAQGYHYGRPMPARDLVRLLAPGRGRAAAGRRRA